MILSKLRDIGSVLYHGFEDLCEQPKPIENQNKSRKYTAVFSVLLCYVLGLVSIAFIITNNKPIQTIEDMNEDEVSLPTIILCPQKNFSAYYYEIETMLSSSSATSLESYMDTLRKLFLKESIRHVGSLGKDEFVARAWPEHRQYDYQVWYNLQLIHKINMSRTDVNDLTRIVREHPDLQFDLPSRFDGYWLALSELAWQREKMIKLGAYGDLMKWKWHVHPNLLDLIAMNSTDRRLQLQHMWKSVVRPRYYMSYRAKEDRPIRRVYDRRFDCQGVLDSECVSQFHQLWLEDRLCVAWHHLKAKCIDIAFPGIIDEHNVWVGNTDIQNIHWADFMPSSKPDKWPRVSEPLWISFDEVHMESQDQFQYRTCQTLINNTRNNMDIRKMFCDANKPAKLEKYSAYFNKRSQHITQPNILRVCSTTTQKITSRTQMSNWRLFTMCGDLLSICTGFSLQIFQSAFQTLGRKYRLALEILYAAASFTAVSVVTYRDLKDSIEHRYITEPRHILVGEMLIPVFDISGKSIGPNLSLNFTKLREYNISDELLSYMCITATGKRYIIDYQTYGTGAHGNLFSNVQPLPVETTNEELPEQFEEFSKPFEGLLPDPRLILFWNRPANTSDLSKYSLQLSALAKVLSINPYKSPAFDILKQFLLDPCKLIVRCSLNDGYVWNCCLQFVHRLQSQSDMMFSLHWPNPDLLRFESGSMSIHINRSEYFHSDAHEPYIAEYEASTFPSDDRGGWLNYPRLNEQIQIKLTVQSKNGGNNAPVQSTYIGTCVNRQCATFNNTHQYQLFIRAKADYQLPGDQYQHRPPCVEDDELTCPIASSLMNFIHIQAVNVICDCRFSVDDMSRSTLNEVDSCSAMKTRSCLLNESLYTGYCYRSDNYTYTIQESVILDRPTNPNDLLITYDDKYKCNWQSLFFDESSKYYLPSINQDLIKKCERSRPCLRYDYDIVEGMTDESFAFDGREGNELLELIISGIDSNEPGKVEVDTLDGWLIYSHIMNACGLIFGASLLAIIIMLFQILKGKAALKAIRKQWSRPLSLMKGGNSTSDLKQTTKKNKIHDIEKMPAAPDREVLYELIPETTVHHPLIAIIIPIAIVTSISLICTMYPLVAYSTVINTVVHFNASRIEPIWVICTSQPNVFLTEHLNEIDLCMYREEKVPCPELFAIRNQFSKRGVRFWCASTMQKPLTAEEPSKSINLSQPLYSSSTLPAVFEKQFVADFKDLFDIQPDNRVTYPVRLISDSDSIVQQINFMQMRTTKYTDCDISRQLSVCKSSNELNQLPCFADDTEIRKTDHPTTNDCETVSYDYFEIFQNISNGDTVKHAIGYTNYFWKETIERPMYNWAMLIPTVGAYFDQIVGVCLLNLIFVFIWWLVQIAIQLYQYASVLKTLAFG